MNQSLIPQDNLYKLCETYAGISGGQVEKQAFFTTTISPGFFYTRNFICSRKTGKYDAVLNDELRNVINTITAGSEAGKPSLTTYTSDIMPDNTDTLFSENGFETLLVQHGMILEPDVYKCKDIDPHVRRINPDELSLWIDTMLEGFKKEDKPREDEIYEKMLQSPDLYFLAYEEDGIFKGTVLLHLLEKYSGIHEVSVPEQYRGHGISKKILNYAFNIVEKNGNHGVALQASDLGRPVYESLGFRKVSELHTVFIK